MGFRLKINTSFRFSNKATIGVIVIIILLQMLFFKDIISGLINIFNTFVMFQINGKVRFKYYSRFKKVKLGSRKVFKIFSALDARFNNTKILKSDYVFTIFLFPLIIFIINFAILLELFDWKVIYFKTIVIVLIFSSSIYFITEFKHIREIILNYHKTNNPLFEINNFGEIKPLENLNCKKHHLKLEAIKTEYEMSSYTKEDIIREISYVKGRSAKVSKPGMYITIVFPIFVLLISGFINVIGVYLNVYMLNPQNPNTLNEFLKYSIGLPSILIFMLVIISFSHEGPSYTNLEDLKLRECILEDMIKESNF